MAVTSSEDPGGNGSARAAVAIVDEDPYSTECLFDPYRSTRNCAGPDRWPGWRRTKSGPRGATSMSAAYSPTGAPL